MPSELEQVTAKLAEFTKSIRQTARRWWKQACDGWLEELGEAWRAGILLRLTRWPGRSLALRWGRSADVTTYPGLRGLAGRSGKRLFRGPGLSVA